MENIVKITFTEEQVHALIRVLYARYKTIGITKKEQQEVGDLINYIGEAEEGEVDYAEYDM